MKKQFPGGRSHTEHVQDQWRNKTCCHYVKSIPNQSVHKTHWPQTKGNYTETCRQTVVLYLTVPWCMLKEPVASPTVVHKHHHCEGEPEENNESAPMSEQCNILFSESVYNRFNLDTPAESRLNEGHVGENVVEKKKKKKASKKGKRYNNMIISSQFLKIRQQYSDYDSILTSELKIKASCVLFSLFNSVTLSNAR